LSEASFLSRYIAARKELNKTRISIIPNRYLNVGTFFANVNFLIMPSVD